MSATTPTEWFSFNLGEVARILKGTRIQSGLSLRQLADLSGNSHSQLLRMESGEFAYSIEGFVSVTRALGLRSGDVLEAAMVFDTKQYPQFHQLELAMKYVGRIQHIEKLADLIDRFWDLSVRLLWATNPIARAKERKYPNDQSSVAFLNYAAFVESFSHQERNVTMASFKERPLVKLQSLHLLPSDELLSSFVKDFWNWDFGQPFPYLNRSKA